MLSETRQMYMKVDRGEKLSDEDVAHLESILADSEEVKRLVDARSDLQDLYTRAVRQGADLSNPRITSLTKFGAS